MREGPFGTFPKIHPIWWRHPCLILRWWPSSSCATHRESSDQPPSSVPVQLDLHQLGPLLLLLLATLLLALLILLVEVAAPLAKQGKLSRSLDICMLNIHVVTRKVFSSSPVGKLSSLPSLVRRLLCSSSRWSEDSSNFFPTSNPSVATQTVSQLCVSSVLKITIMQRGQGSVEQLEGSLAKARLREQGQPLAPGGNKQTNEKHPIESLTMNENINL